MNRIAKLLLPLTAMVAAVPAIAAAPVTGNWTTQDKDAVVTIAKCGKSLCGKITRFLVTPPDGADQRDVNNPSAKLRNRKILGMVFLSGFTEDGDEWRGRIYDPKSGKSYRSILQRKGNSALAVKGCIGPFCQTQTWTR